MREEDIQKTKYEISTSEVTTLWRYTNMFIIIIIIISTGLQCFDAVGWAAKRASGV